MRRTKGKCSSRSSLCALVWHMAEQLGYSTEKIAQLLHVNRTTVIRIFATNEGKPNEKVFVVPLPRHKRTCAEQLHHSANEVIASDRGYLGAQRSDVDNHASR